MNRTSIFFIGDIFHRKRRVSRSVRPCIVDSTRVRLASRAPFVDARRTSRRRRHGLDARDERDERPDADLRERLHAMEAKVRKLREIRNQHSDRARRSRDQRNAVQAQYKEHRETVDLLIAEVKAIRAEVNLHRERRNAIQDQLKQFIAQIKGRRGDKDAKRSATAEYHQLKAEMERLEETFETSSVGMKKEKEMMEKLKPHSPENRHYNVSLKPFVCGLKYL